MMRWIMDILSNDPILDVIQVNNSLHACYTPIYGTVSYFECYDRLNAFLFWDAHIWVTHNRGHHANE